MGIPTPVFRLLHCLLSIASVNAYALSPILLLSIVSLVLAICLDDVSVGLRVFLGVLTLALAVVYAYALYWTKQYPKIPEDKSFQIVPISNPDAFPKAPANVLRGDLIAKENRWMKDSFGRNMLLHGANLTGSCKVPTGPENGSTWNPNSLSDWKNVTFIGRPFDLDGNEADLHLSRLRAWGYTFCRFLITWEAIEHEGPGVYDTEYLAYLQSMVRKCDEYGISVFIDPHQDVWSRWTGGDGAPAWTLQKVGFDLEKLNESGAAFTQQEQGKDYEDMRMFWNSNNMRLAGGTMWTLFFAGNDFAPKTFIDGEPVQDYLQRHYCAAITQVARALKDEKNVLGFDTLNEPSNGWVGLSDMRDISDNQFYLGWRVDPWTAIQLGAGETKSVDFFQSFLTYGGKRSLNKSGAVAWSNGRESCIWRSNGVWDFDENGNMKLMKPNYFKTNPKTNKKIDFIQDHMVPFWRKVTQSIRSEISDAIMFIEPHIDLADPVGVENPNLGVDDLGTAGIVWAKHWYDGITLMTQSFNKWLGLDAGSGSIYIGLKNIQKGHGKELERINEDTKDIGESGKGTPVLIGECGIPFNMKPSPFLDENFDMCMCAMNTTMRSLEHALVSFTLWNYTPDNTNEHGDLWNIEDLSIFSKDQINEDNKDDLHGGGRCLAAVVRPYGYKIAGIPLQTSFDPYMKEREFRLSFRTDPNVKSNETIIFLPSYHYPEHRVHVTVSDGHYQVDWEHQTLKYYHSDSVNKHSIVIWKPNDVLRESIDGRKSKFSQIPNDNSEVEMPEKVPNAV